MIHPGDEVLVGLSGGKDSGLLLYALRRLRSKSPIRFGVSALTIDPTGLDVDTSPLVDFARDLGVGIKVVRYPIFNILDRSAGKSPCSLCANIRRGILASSARELGCNVIALGHHRDDVAETVLMNVLYSGRFSCFSPNMLMSRSGVRVIRPLVYVPEMYIMKESRKLMLPIIDFKCRYAGGSKRALMKSMIAELASNAGPTARDIQGSVMHALSNCSGASAWNGARTCAADQGVQCDDID
jgi:tRNA(Ile)-lysidine synthase TilS/MesJ